MKRGQPHLIGSAFAGSACACNTAAQQQLPCALAAVAGVAGVAVRRKAATHHPLPLEHPAAGASAMFIFVLPAAHRPHTSCTQVPCLAV